MAAPKKHVTPDELRAQAAAIEEAQEISTLKRQLAEAQTTIAALRKSEEALRRDLKQYQEAADGFQAAVRKINGRAKTYNPNSSASEAARITSRSNSAYVRAGITNGTHDPVTGLEYGVETEGKPKDFSDPKTVVREGDLAKFFPAINGPAETPVVTEE